MTVTGKVVLITGAGSGIGATTARTLAQSGARVVVSDRDQSSARGVCRDITDKGGMAIAVTADVTDEDQVEALVAATVEEYGRLDGAVNNAAAPPDSQYLDNLDVDEFDKVIAVNLRGVALCMKHELRQMYRQGGGSIVNLGSIRSFRPRVGNAAYVASKHGVVGLTTVGSLEAAPRGVRVNAVCPGAIQTPMLRGFLESRGRTVEDFTAEMSPLGRLGTPEDIAHAILWLCSDTASFVTGVCLPVDGGYTSS